MPAPLADWTLEPARRVDGDGLTVYTARNPRLDWTIDLVVWKVAPRDGSAMTIAAERAARFRGELGHSWFEALPGTAPPQSFSFTVGAVADGPVPRRYVARSRHIGASDSVLLVRFPLYVREDRNAELARLLDAHREPDVKLFMLADRDADGIPDASDVCPEQPENLNGHEDEDGCPDRSVGCNVIDGKIEILDTLRFARGRAALLGGQDAIMAAIATTLRENPRITRVAVVGHVAEGEVPELAARRAEVVREALRKAGVKTELELAAAPKPGSPIVGIEIREQDPRP